MSLKRSSLLLLAYSLLHGGLIAQQAPVDSVNPLIGTAAEGQTFPAAGVPFAMAQWTPQTRDGETKCVAPYYFADTRIQGFRGSHFLSGSCTQDYGSVTVMPLTSDRVLDPAGRASRFDHTHEHSRPYEYSVDLLDSGIHADVTSSTRVGALRFQFPKSLKQGIIAVQENHRLGVGSVRIDVARQEVAGQNPVYRIYAGNGKPAGFAGYFVVRFSQPFTLGGTWSNSARQDGAIDPVVGKGSSGAFVRFLLKDQPEVLVKVGTSFTSVDEARRNLEELPGWNFDTDVQQARQTWSKSLDAVQLGSGTSVGDRTTFYTALYHSMLLPRVFSDRSGTYPSFAGGGKAEVASDFTDYDDFSLWDTFRAVHPLMTILQPKRERDMVKSLIAKGEQGGFMPIFPAWNSYTSEMVGDHANAVIADAYAKGIRDFDVQSAYRLMKKNATELPVDPALYLDGRGRRGLTSYLQYGYIPLEDHLADAFHPNEQVSRTLEYAYDDFLVAQMARWTGHPQDEKPFMERAQNYRKVIDPAVGYARGRHQDGTWVAQFQPHHPATWITESLPSVYTFFVLQDIPGLVKLLGGNQVFTQRLDQIFENGDYDHGNEPSHHLAYLYNFAGHPEKTDLRVRQILRQKYAPAPAGLAGNDDAGQMSAWYVFSALGFYPVTPGTPRYELGVPLFSESTLHLPNGHTLHVLAPGADEGRYMVRQIKLNGHPLGRSYLLHDELLAGGELCFELSAETFR